MTQAPLPSEFVRFVEKLFVTSQTGNIREAVIVDYDDEGSRILIHYEGYDSDFDEWIFLLEGRIASFLPRGLRAPENEPISGPTALKVGDRLFVQSASGMWRAGIVQAVEATGVSVHFEGFHASKDEFIEWETRRLALPKENELPPPLDYKHLSLQSQVPVGLPGRQREFGPTLPLQASLSTPDLGPRPVSPASFSQPPSEPATPRTPRGGFFSSIMSKARSIRSRSPSVAASAAGDFGTGLSSASLPPPLPGTQRGPGTVSSVTSPAAHAGAGNFGGSNVGASSRPMSPAIGGGPLVDQPGGFGSGIAQGSLQAPRSGSPRTLGGGSLRSARDVAAPSFGSGLHGNLSGRLSGMRGGASGGPPELRASSAPIAEQLRSQRSNPTGRGVSPSVSPVHPSLATSRSHGPREGLPAPRSGARADLPTALRGDIASLEPLSPRTPSPYGTTAHVPYNAAAAADRSVSPAVDRTDFAMVPEVPRVVQHQHPIVQVDTIAGLKEALKRGDTIDFDSLRPPASKKDKKKLGSEEKGALGVGGDIGFAGLVGNSLLQSEGASTVEVAGASNSARGGRDGAVGVPASSSPKVKKEKKEKKEKDRIREGDEGEGKGKVKKEKEKEKEKDRSRERGKEKEGAKEKGGGKEKERKEKDRSREKDKDGKKEKEARRARDRDGDRSDDEGASGKAKGERKKEKKEKDKERERDGEKQRKVKEKKEKG